MNIAKDRKAYMYFSMKNLKTQKIVLKDYQRNALEK